MNSDSDEKLRMNKYKMAHPPPPRARNPRVTKSTKKKTKENKNVETSKPNKPTDILLEPAFPTAIALCKPANPHRCGTRAAHHPSPSNLHLT